MRARAGGSLTEERRLTVSSFQSMMQKVKSGSSVSNEEILLVAPLFDEDFTLEHLNREQLAAMCRLLDLRVFGSEWVLRHKLTRKLHALRDDDKAIAKEGIDSLTLAELQEACRARGIHSAQSESYMKRKLKDWLELSLEHDVPISLLVLSRAFSQSLASGKETELSQDLATTLKHIPDIVVQDTQTTVADLTVDPEEKLKLIQQEESMAAEATQSLKAQQASPVSKEGKSRGPTVVGLTELKEKIEDIQEENDEVEEDIDEAMAADKAAAHAQSHAATEVQPVKAAKPATTAAPVMEKKKVRKVDILNDQVENLIDRVQVELEKHEQQQENSPAAPSASIEQEKPKADTERLAKQ